jgi:hypothetical protein
MELMMIFQKLFFSSKRIMMTNAKPLILGNDEV